MLKTSHNAVCWNNVVGWLLEAEKLFNGRVPPPHMMSDGADTLSLFWMRDKKSMGMVVNRDGGYTKANLIGSGGGEYDEMWDIKLTAPPPSSWVSWMVRHVSCV